MEFLQKEFYNNTIIQWGIALIILILSLALSKFIAWVSTTILKRLAKGTESNLDDHLIDKLDDPLKYLAVIGGIYFSTVYLTIENTFIEGAIFGLCKFLLIINITWLLSRVLDTTLVTLYDKFMENEENNNAFYTHFFPVLRKAVRNLLWGLGIIVGLDNVGIDVTTMIAGLGIGGLALALAAQDVIKNVFGGVMILLDKPFQVGDRVQVNGFDGNIEEVGLRSTRIRTLDGRLVTLPNSKFSDNSVVNVSAEPHRKITSTIGIACESTPLQLNVAMTTLGHILHKHSDDIEDDTTIGFNSFGDYTLNLILVYRITSGSDITATQTSINTMILERFNEAGIEMPYPTKTIIEKEVG